MYFGVSSELPSRNLLDARQYAAQEPYIYLGEDGRRIVMHGIASSSRDQITPTESGVHVIEVNGECR